MAVAPPTNPGEAFGAGDPRNAKYFENLAALEHAYTTTLAGDKEGLTNARSNSSYQQSLLTKAEPGTYRTNRERANTGGIAESGINAQRRGTIASQYGQKRFALTHGLQETEGRLRKSEEAAKYNYDSGRAKAATGALGEGYSALLAQQPNESVPTAPTGSGVVPKETGGHGQGFTRVGMPLHPMGPVGSAVRKAAAKKVVG